MVDNARMLLAAFPDAIVKIYVASDVPAYVTDVLVRYPNVRIVHVPRMRGIHNMYDRFRAYDDDDYDILFVRDADSRIRLRDQDCIRQFCASDRMFHIIRDHKGHEQLIMGGMWGARKGAIRGLSEPLATVAETFQQVKANSSLYGGDQDFLAQVIYPLVKDQTMVHDAQRRFASEVSLWADFGYPLVNDEFVGQIWSYNPPRHIEQLFYPDGPSDDVCEPLFRLIIENL
jgi:hypothetical protein